MFVFPPFLNPLHIRPYLLFSPYIPLLHLPFLFLALSPFFQYISYVPFFHPFLISVSLCSFILSFSMSPLCIPLLFSSCFSPFTLFFHPSIVFLFLSPPYVSFFHPSLCPLLHVPSCVVSPPQRTPSCMFPRRNIYAIIASKERVVCRVSVLLSRLGLVTQTLALVITLELPHNSRRALLLTSHFNA